MALTLTRATLSVDEGTGTSISATANIPGTATAVWAGWTIDDQGTTARTITADIDGTADVQVVAMKSEALSGPAFGVHRKFPPATGAAVAITISASPAFANRQWRLMVVYAEGGDTVTPNDAANLFENATATSTSNTTSSAVGDQVLAFVMADNRTVGTTAPNPAPTQDFGELNTAGGVYLGASRTDGAASVSTGWGWGGSSIIAAEAAFNVNAAAAAGGNLLLKSAYYL